LHLSGYFAGTSACVLALFLCCGCAYNAGTTSSDLAGRIKIVGSTALLPLAAAAAAAFEQHHPHVQIDVEGGGSIVGLRAITSAKADIGDSDTYADPGTFPDPNLTDHIVCILPITLIVGSAVTIPSLTQQQVVAIFSTKTIHNWREVGGPDLPITVISRPATSGTRAIFRKNILGGLDESGRILTDSSQAVRDVVAHTPGAIGYLALPYLNASVRAISIDGQMASSSSITTNRYHFWGYEHMYTQGVGNSLVAAFLSFVNSPEGQRLVQNLHYIPTA